MVRKRILVAEDDPDDQQFLQEAFDSHNADAELLFVNSGEKVLPYLEQLQDHELPILILLDYNLPQVTGYEVLMSICAISRYQNMIKIVWSTSASPVYELACRKAGAYAYFPKPITFASIRSLAGEMLQICEDQQIRSVS